MGPATPVTSSLECARTDERHCRSIGGLAERRNPELSAEPHLHCGASPCILNVALVFTACPKMSYFYGLAPCMSCQTCPCLKITGSRSHLANSIIVQAKLSASSTVISLTFSAVSLRYRAPSILYSTHWLVLRRGVVHHGKLFTEKPWQNHASPRVSPHSAQPVPSTSHISQQSIP